jgi:hypothetical protein
MKVSYNQKQMLLIVILVGAILYMLTQRSGGIERFSVGACTCGSYYNRCGADDHTGWCSTGGSGSPSYSYGWGCGAKLGSSCTRSYTEASTAPAWKPGEKQPTRLNPQPNPKGGAYHSEDKYRRLGLGIPSYEGK